MTSKPTSKTPKPAPMTVVYGVKWIEVDFGQRDEGWALFMDKAECFKSTKKASHDGPYAGGGYLGPERPLTAFEIPFASLDRKYKNALRKTGKAHTDDHWSPKFRGARHSIEP